MNQWITPQQALQAAYGPNPLLEALGPHMDVKALAMRLRQEPLATIPWQRVRPHEREEFLPFIEDHFVPTLIAVAAAESFQMLLRQYYLRRNPLWQRTRMQLNTLSELRGERIQTVPWFNSSARAMALRGITGVGKSATLDRILSLYPRVVEHDACPAAGWLQQRQLVWLKVQMSGDASRAGFLTQILAAVDAVLGTDYHEQYGTKQRWTVEKLMVIVGIILSRHYCGALIIEELQWRNFGENGSNELLLLFFLRLLNFGIPIVLVGNPLGFRAFDSFSQDVRRLYSAGCFDFWPSDAVDDAGWQKFYLPGLAKFSVLDKPFEWTDRMKEKAIYESGGVPGFMACIWHACQRKALQTGEHTITEADIELAASDPILLPQRRLIHALRTQDVAALAECEDVPWDDFDRRWPKPVYAGKDSPLAGNTTAAQVSPQAPVDGVVPKFLKGERTYASRVTRAQKIATAPKTKYPKGDLRNDDTRAALQSGLAALRDGLTDGETASPEPQAA